MNLSAVRTTIFRILLDALRPEGFRRKGRILTRERDDVVHIVDLQGSVSNSQQIGRYTVNLGVWVSALEPESSISVHEAHWRERLGYVCPEVTDLWWTVSSPEQADQVATELAQRMAQYGLPALNEIPNAASLLALWRSGISPGLTEVQARRFAASLSRLAGDA